MKDFVLRIVEIYKPFRKIMYIIFLFTSCTQALLLVTPYMYGKIIDSIISKKSLNEVLFFAGITFCMALVITIMRYYQERFELYNLDFAVSQYVSKKTLGAFFGYSIGQHNNENSGIKQSVITKGEHALTTFAYTVLYDIFPMILQILFTIVALLYLSVTLGLMVLCGVVIFVLFSLYLNLNIKDDLKRYEDMDHDKTKAHTEILRNAELVQVNAQEQRVITDYDNRYSAFADFGKIIWVRYCFGASFRSLVIDITKFMVIATGSYYVYKGLYTPGYLIVFLSWSSNAFNKLGMFGSTHRKCIELYIAIKKFFALFDVKPEVTIITNPVRPKSFLGRIEFKDVSFQYMQRDFVDTSQIQNIYPTLSHVSFVIEKGQSVAFVGHSGAGKSTIAHLLMRAYDPCEGQIMIDGNDLRILDLTHYRQSIGLVEQDVCLFDNTLRYNVVFGLNGRGALTGEQELRDIAKLSCMDQFYPRLEKGFDTPIGERGVKLSGGERQRVGIARALIKDPKFLIFDEATSSLDTQNESLIRRSIKNASCGRTTIIIAHRFSTIRDVDKIFVLHHGKIVGEGVHVELLKNCAQYRVLVQNQVVIA